MKKIFNTVLALVLVVVMALVGFVYYAWMVQKRSRTAAETMAETNRLIDKVRTIALLENNYTTSIRDMLLKNQTHLAPGNLAISDSIQQIFNHLKGNQLLDSTSNNIIYNLQHIIDQKNNYNQQVLSAATNHPDLARQLITAPEGIALRTALISEVNAFIHFHRSTLISRVDKDLHYTLYSFWTTIIISIFTIILISGEARYIFKLFKKLRKSANQLHKREQSFIRLAEETELIIYKSSVDGYFTSVSKRVAEMTGYTSAELLGQHYSIFLSDETYKELDIFYTSQVTNEDDYTFKQFEIITKSGNKKWVEQLAMIIYGNDGKVKEFQCMVRDIDKEKTNEDQFQYLQQRLESILDYMPSMMFVKDMPGRYLLVNNRFAEMMNVKKKDIVGKTDSELPFDWVDKYAALDTEVITTNNRVKMEDIIYRNGKEYHFLITKFPLRNPENEMIGICGIGQDFTEKANYIAAVEEANKRGKEAIAAQEMFLANMSHEIRTPMNGIIGMTNLMMTSQLTPKQLNYVTAIKSSATRLMSIITEVLDFSKIKAGKLYIQEERFDLHEVVSNTLLPLKLQAENKHLTFINRVDNNIPQYLVGDDVKLTQILTNLVENAIKFTAEGSIIVKIFLAPKQPVKGEVNLRFTITDTGIGIAPEKHDLIFKSFSQTHTSNSRKYGGAGLGLAITKELVLLLNGSIKVDSTLNAGATFQLELPFIISQKSAVEQETGKLAQTNAPLIGKTILIVEDDDINQQVAFQTLHDAGARVDVVENGKTALQILDYKKYDCIIMDIQMPEMDGYETTNRIRDKNISTHIIAMTASALEDEKSRCLNAGMNDYVSKPFEPADLIYKILKGTGEKVIDPPKAATVQVPVNSNLSFEVVYKMFSGEKANVKKLLKELVKVMPQKFSELHQLAQSEKWDAFYILAHQMKFNLSVAGMPDASLIAQEMEADARQMSNLDNISERIDKMETIYLQNVQYIEEHLASV